jgi:hypothetical protein
MSNARYIEIDSAYRDRTRNPLASDFEVPLSQTGLKGKLSALDPVSDATPLISWQSNEFTVGGGITLNATILAGDPDSVSTSPSVLIITSPAGTMQRIKNYYRSAIANNTSITSKRRIINFEFLGSTAGGADKGIITLSSPYPDTFALGDTITISDPTDFSDILEPLVFVPGGLFGNNAYSGDLLYNETLNQYRIIDGYNEITRLLQVDTSSASVAGWLSTHIYSIRRSQPLDFGSMVGISTTSATLWPASSAVDGIYIGDFLRIKRTSAVLTAPENEARRIVSYNGTTKLVSVYPPFSTAIPIASEGEILPFSRDNLAPMNYSGSTVSQQQMVCYEVGLLNLVIPNSTIKSGDRGSHIAFYPYLYVELSNSTAPSSGLNNIIYSNNPNATRMLFRATINNVNNPTVASFVNITGNSMVQTIKFKPNDNLHFRVTLSNGESFETTEKENISPFLPNPLAQISALFSIKRL